MNEKQDRRKKLLRQGFGVDPLYVLLLFGALAISGMAHVGLGKLPLPDLMFDGDLKASNELEVDWVFTSKEKAPLQKEPLPEPEPPRFVETNPNVPGNEPDETLNESDRNQQAAQEEPEPKKLEDAPKVEGETEHSQKIIQGRIAEKTPKPEPGIFALEERPTPETEKDPLKDEGEDKKRADAPPPPPAAPEEIKAGTGNGVASVQQDKIETKDHTRNTIIPIELPNRPDPVAKEPEELTPIKVQSLRPKPRPRLPASVIPGPLRDTKTSSARTGTLAIDAKWSEFGEYTQRMLAAISLQWHNLVYPAPLDSELASTVHVRFILNNKGVVENIKIIQTSAGKLASGLCKDAIGSRQPFGLWTADMVNTFGERTEVNIRFNYR